MKRVPLLTIIVRTTLVAFLDFSPPEQLTASILFTFSRGPMPHATLHVAALEHSGRCYPAKRYREIVRRRLDVRPRSQPVLANGRNSAPGNGGWK